MKRISIILLAFFCQFSIFCEELNLEEILRSLSVTVYANGSYGSGTVFVHNISDKKTAFILTAAHVVKTAKGKQKIKALNDAPQHPFKEGEKVEPFKEIEVDVFQNVSVITNIYSGVNKVIKVIIPAEVIKYSPTYDLAILKLGDATFFDRTAIAHTDSSVLVKIGTKIWTVGSQYGESSPGVVTPGAVIATDVRSSLVPHLELDQLSTSVTPGCSGGGVFKFDERLVGIAIIRTENNQCLMVPVRIIEKWLRLERIEWFLDRSKPTPSNEKLSKMKVFDSLF